MFNKPMIALAMLTICVVLAALEFLVNSPETARLASENISELVDEDKIIDEEVEEYRSVFMKYVGLSSFQNSGMEDVRMENLMEAKTIFRVISIDNAQDRLTAVSALFKQEKSTLTKIIEFHPNSEITTSRMFSVIKVKLIEYCDSNPGFTVNQTDDFGENSFYFNNKDFPDMVFLVAKSSNKMLAFEYEKKNHQKITDVVRGIMQ